MAIESATDLASQLRAFLGHAPDDLLAYFEELESAVFIESGAKELADLLSVDAAIALTPMLRGAHPLTSMLGALVLDESNTSNYHLYLPKPPLQGCIMYLSHDGDYRIVFDSPQSMLAAINAGVKDQAGDDDFHLDDRHPQCSPIVADQAGLIALIEANLEHEDADILLPVLTACMELKDTPLLRHFATHRNFFVAEGLGEAIEKRPARELLELADLCAAHPHCQAADAGRRAARAIRRLDRKPSFWIDGVETPCRLATFSIEIGRDPWLTDAEKAAFGTDFRRIIYTLEIDVNEHSGEDGACAPAAQCIPIWRAAGNRHPSLDNLAKLEVNDIDDWDAWFGNDAPALRNNRLHFHGWNGATHLQCTWHAEVVKSAHGGADEPHAIAFDGEAEFAGIKVSAENLEGADQAVKAIWGEAHFEALRRTYYSMKNPYQGRRPSLSKIITTVKRWFDADANEGRSGERIFLVTYMPASD